MKKVLNNIKIESIELLSYSTSHAISAIVKAKGPYLKLLWLIAGLISASFFAYLISLDIIFYLKFPVTTNVRYIDERMVPFPAVGVCHVNPFTTKASIVYIKEVIENKFNHTKPANINDLEFINEILNDDANGQDIKDHLEFSYPGHNFSIKDPLGMPIEDLILKCQFNGIKCNLSTDFTVKYTFINGKCFFYNLNGTKESKALFPSDGLTLELFSGFEQRQPTYKPSNLD